MIEYKLLKLSNKLNRRIQILLDQHFLRGPAEVGMKAGELFTSARSD